MKDQRGPAIRSLTRRSGRRRYWRYEHKEADESAWLWYFECVVSDDEWWCIRQIASHPGGVSAYDWQNLEDAHGFLTDQPIDEHDPLLEPISAAEFHAAWREAAKERPSPS